MIRLPYRCPSCTRSVLTRPAVFRLAQERGGWVCRPCSARRLNVERHGVPQVQARAVLLRKRGYRPAEIVQHLADEGHVVSRQRVSFWTVCA